MATSLPPSFLQSLHNAPGFDEEAFVRAHTEYKPVTSIRYNPAKIERQEIEDTMFEPARPVVDDAPLIGVQKQVPWCSTGRYLTGRPSFTHDPLLHAGAYYVQEASSMFLDHVVQTLFANQPPPGHVLDLCAAPGGKSTLLAAALPQSFIVSNEVIKNRVTILAENLSKWGASNVAVTHNDAADFKQLPGYFDLVVVDAPCSGSGLFRKDERAINEWSLANVEHCSLRQQRILADVLPALSTGGYLVYSTCSYSPAEDENICDWLVHDAGLQSVAIPIEHAWGIVETYSPKQGAAGYRFYPDKVGGEGFFIACFQQQQSAATPNEKIAELSPINKKDAAIVDNWLQEPGRVYCFAQKDTIIGFPAQWLKEFSTVQKKLHVRKSGVAIGTIKGGDLVPHHELALATLSAATVPAILLDKQQALKYLARQDIALQTDRKGWALARYNHLNLGWMKLLGNRFNNYYPTDWRILKP